jgi:hypothetical protein
MRNAKMLNLFRSKKDLINLFVVRFLTGLVTLFEILYLPVLIGLTFKLFDYQRSILINFAILATFGLHSGYFVLFYKLKNKILSIEIFKSTILLILISFVLFFTIFVIYDFQNVYSLPLAFSFLIILILEKFLVIKNKLIFSQTIKALNSLFYLMFGYFFIYENYQNYILLTGLCSVIGLFVIIKIFIPEFLIFFSLNKIRFRRSLFKIIFDLGYKQIIATFLFGIIIILIKAIFLDFYPDEYNAYSTIINLIIMYLVLNSVLNLYYNKNFASAANNQRNIKSFLKSHLKPLIIIYFFVYIFFTPSLIYYFKLMDFEFETSFIFIGIFCITFLFLIEYFNYVVIFLNKQLFYVLSQVFIILLYTLIYYFLKFNIIGEKIIEIYLLVPFLFLGIINMFYLIKKFKSI